MPLDPRRAREVAGAGRKAEEWRAKRDELIRQAHADGASYREIAALVGLSHVGVMKIVGKEANDERDQRINAIKRERERLTREAREQDWNGLKRPEDTP